eukprot:gene16583-biopygen11014
MGTLGNELQSLRVWGGGRPSVGAGAVRLREGVYRGRQRTVPPLRRDGAGGDRRCCGEHDRCSSHRRGESHRARDALQARRCGARTRALRGGGEMEWG